MRAAPHHKATDGGAIEVAIKAQLSNASAAVYHLRPSIRVRACVRASINNFKKENKKMIQTGNQKENLTKMGNRELRKTS